MDELLKEESETEMVEELFSKMRNEFGEAVKALLNSGTTGLFIDI